MPLFKKRIDPLSATMKLVEAIAADDRAEIDAATRDVEPLSVMDIFFSLSRFGEMFAPAFNAEHEEVMRDELMKMGGPPDVENARVAIGLSLLYKPAQATYTEAINIYGSRLTASSPDLLTQVALEIVIATGRISRRLEIKFKWK
jgi:hypothetical protein